MFELLGICLSFAAFFLLHAVLTFLVELLWKKMQAWHFQSAANRASLIFLLRMTPLIISISSVGLFLLPAFLLNEPRQNTESIGWPLGFFTLVSMGGLIFAIGRLGLAIWHTYRLEQRWQANAALRNIPGIQLPVFCLATEFPVVAVVGIFRPRLYIAEHLFRVLNQQELAATIAHERGHLFSSDNLKRILLRLSRDLLLSIPFGEKLETDWQYAAEAAADEFAVRSGKANALDLASALIKIARQLPSNNTYQFPLGAAIIGENATGIASRVTSLLELANVPPTKISAPLFSRKTIVVLVITSIFAIAFCFQHLFTILSRLHAMTEIIVSVMQ